MTPRLPADGPGSHERLVLAQINHALGANAPAATRALLRYDSAGKRYEIVVPAALAGGLRAVAFDTGSQERGVPSVFGVPVRVLRPRAAPVPPFPVPPVQPLLPARLPPPQPPTLPPPTPPPAAADNRAVAGRLNVAAEAFAQQVMGTPGVQGVHAAHVNGTPVIRVTVGGAHPLPLPTTWLGFPVVQAR